MSFLALAVARLKDKELFSRNHICEGHVDLIQLAAQGSLQLDIDLGAAEGDGKAAAALRDSSALRCWLRVQVSWRPDQQRQEENDGASKIRLGTTLIQPISDPMPGDLPEGYEPTETPKSHSCSSIFDPLFDPFAYFCAAPRKSNGVVSIT